MTNDIRLPMALNAAFSLATGLFMAVAPGTVGGWLGVEIDGWLRLLGIGLVGHGLVLFWARMQTGVLALAKLNLAAIPPYPAIMIALVATGLIDRPLGQVLAMLDGAVIAAIAGWHWLGLRRPESVRQSQPA